MENNPRKSKALIIAIIFIIFLLIVGFLVYKNRDKFGEKTSETISKIFSPLVPSLNSKNLKTVDENSIKVVAQAGEDIKAGDNLSLSGTDENNNPIVVKAGKGGNIYGFAGQDFSYGELGEVIINGGNPNGFFNSFSDFLNNLFNGNDNQNDMPFGGWSFDNGLGIWVFDPNGNGGWVFDPNGNGWVPPGGGSGSYNPQCSDMLDNDTDGGIDVNDPNCHLGGTLSGEYLPNHYSESSNPLGGGGFDFTPQCSDTEDNDTDGGIDVNDPNCHLGGTLSGEYLPNHYSESSNPWGGVLTYECNDEVDNDSDTLIDTLDPACHTGGVIEGEYLPNHDSEADAPCENGANNPPVCTTFDKEKIPDLTAGSISPTTALSGAQTTIYASILNIGNGGTTTSFPTLFTITNKNMTETELNGGDNVVSQSKFKKLISKIFNSATWVSIVKAATTGDVGIIINVNLSVTTPQINASETKTISTTYNFATPGRYYIRACADKSSLNDRGVIVETNEDNNCGPWTIFNSSISLPPPGELPKCSDTIDNDRDSFIDDLDPGCHLNGNLDEIYIPSHDSESIASNTVYECNDNLDNDSDGKIDTNDTACHLDGKIENDYVPEHDSETIAPVGPQEENICLAVQQNPLVFTDEEKSELAELLRKFYLLAPNLKSEDDISIIYNEIERNKQFIGQLTVLTNQCYDQGFRKDGGSNPNWDWTPTWNGEGAFAEAPMHRYGNPWFKGKEKAWNQQYFDYNLIDTKMVSGYFSGTTREFKLGDDVIVEAGLDCDYFTPRPSSGYAFYTLKRLPPPLIGQFGGWNSPSDCNDNNYGELPGADSSPEWAVCSSEAIYAGCKWEGGTTYQELELLLNVW